MTSLENQAVLVIGGSSGMGLATARALAVGGAHVTIAGRSEAKLAAALAALPEGVRGLAVDFADETSVAGLFDRTGPLDHLVLCASSSPAWGPFASLPTAALETAFKNKFWGYWHASRHVLPVLAERGSILMVTGAAARASLPGTAGLAAVNGAIAAFARTLAAEFAPRRVNVVSPGLVATEAYAGLPEAQRTAMFADAARRLPTGRTGEAEDIAGVILAVLASPFMTGAVVDVDGGVSLARG